MLHFLPAFILGPLSFILIVINTLLWTPPLIVFSFIKMLLPFEKWRDFWTPFVLFVTENWAVGNVWLTTKLLDIEWDIQIDAALDYKGSYIVLPNHQSWADIVMMQVALNKKIPFFRFFLKQELIWVPILNIAWIALDFPFMKRHTKEQIAKDPSLKGKDIETTKKACAKYKNHSVAIANFLEGTRFTQEKHDRQNSPYRHLLRPKAGGIAFALSVMDGNIDQLLDVTIVYPDGKSGIWDLMSGHLSKVIIRVSQSKIPEDILYGDYENDMQFRKRFQAWVTEHWQQKDALIDSLLGN